MCWVSALIYSKIITTTGLAKTSILSHNSHFFFVVRTLKIYFLSSFQVHDRVVLAIVAMLTLDCSSCSSCNWKMSFPLSPAPGHHHFILCFHEFWLFEFMYLFNFWPHQVFVVACGLSPIVANGGYSSLQRTGLLWWLPLLQSLVSIPHVTRYLSFSV